MALPHYAAKFDPCLFLDCPSPAHQPGTIQGKERETVLPSGNFDIGRTRARNRTEAQSAQHGGAACTGNATELKSDNCSDNTCERCKYRLLRIFVTAVGQGPNIHKI